MANNYVFPLANFPAQLPQHRQPGHWGGYLLGARQTPPPPTQQDLGVALTNSDGHGFENLCGFMGMANVGTGPGWTLLTLAEPIPSARVTGYLHY